MLIKQCNVITLMVLEWLIGKLEKLKNYLIFTFLRKTYIYKHFLIKNSFCFVSCFYHFNLLYFCLKYLLHIFYFIALYLNFINLLISCHLILVCLIFIYFLLISFKNL